MLKKLYNIFESRSYQHFVAFLIVCNAGILALRSYYVPGNDVHTILSRIDVFILIIFIVEIISRIIIQKNHFWKNPWNIFDFFVISFAVFPALFGLPSLVPLRILRLFHVVYVLPKLRRLVLSLFSSLPYIGSIFILLFLIVFVYSVLGVDHYGQTFPEYFGTLHQGLLTMFTLITLENWTGLLEIFMEKHPYSWIFFISFILIATFIVFNLFIGVIVDAMSQQAEEGMEKPDDALMKLRQDVEEIKLLLKK
jgi:voltage-gated sodium channel